MFRLALPAPIGTVQTAKLGLNLGDKYMDEKGNEYIFLQGVASTAIGSWVNYYPATDLTDLVTKTIADKLYPMAIAMAAVVASDYGWYLIHGVAPASVLDGSAIEAAVYTSATAGSMATTSTSQSKVNRALVLVANSSGSTANRSVQIAFPGEY